MSSAADDVEDNLESYKAQLKQVEAALHIDQNNEDLQRLKEDLLEVIVLTEELLEINDVVDEPIASASTIITDKPEVGEEPVVEPIKPIKPKEWKTGDRVQAIRKLDGQWNNGTVDMISDDKLSCTVKFDNSGSVDVVKISSLKPVQSEPQTKVESTSNTQVKNVNTNTKLTKEEVDKRREIKKKKLLRKKQRMKEFEEAREAGKQRWQQFYKKGSLKGKHKVKGLNKKSIFASREDGKGKIGVGTCGTSGKGMTEYTPASAYMYKK